jgi:hypothetical protein
MYDPVPPKSGADTPVSSSVRTVSDVWTGAKG